VVRSGVLWHCWCDLGRFLKGGLDARRVIRREWNGDRWREQHQVMEQLLARNAPFVALAPAFSFLSHPCTHANVGCS